MYLITSQIIERANFGQSGGQELPKLHPMILTQCAVCATDLGLTLGKKCGRCSTRYCGPECQKQHWERGGHDKLCKKIKKAGGAEQYNANKKYTEAVAVAAEACAEDTKGQTCYICTQALHWKSKEGLVRGCSCRGTAGFAHVSCLAEQAKILVAEAEENHLGIKAEEERFERWSSCSLCEQDYHGVVQCALGWACWKTHVGRPETDGARYTAISILGNGLGMAGQHQDALFVQEAELSTLRRLGAPEENILVVQSNLAGTYQELGRLEEANRMLRDVYSGRLNVSSQEHEVTLKAALNYANSLVRLNRFEEAKALIRKMMPAARRVPGESHDVGLTMRWLYAVALYEDPAATLEGLREAVTTLEDVVPIARRVLGGTHPLVEGMEISLRAARAARAALAAREGDDVSSVCEGVAAMTPPGGA